MGEPPLMLHDWFAAVAPSTLAGDRELAIVLYGRVEANPGVVDDRPSALQLVKRLGTDAFRTGTGDEARTVKLVGVLARERAVAAGVDEVVINTFKTGISPHYEFLLRAAREQKPHKVNLRAAFPPPARSTVPEPTPVQAPTPSRKPRSLTPSLLDLGSDYQRPAGAPGSMHELAEGLRRARQLRRPLSAQRVADRVPEPRTLPDRDAGWSPARKQPVEVPKEAPRNAADRSTPQLVEREHAVSMEADAVESAAQPDKASRDVGAESSIPEVDKEVGIKEVSQPPSTTKEQESRSQIGKEALADVGPATAPALVQIDCRPKSVKQALAVTVLRFFLGSKSESTAGTSASAPASAAQRVPSQRTVPAEPEAIVAPNRPRRLSEPISRFQANMASLLSLSEQLSKQATKQAAPDASVAAPALAVQARSEEIAADEAPMELDDKARDSAADEHAQDTPVSAAKDDGTVELGPAPAITDAEDVDMKAVAEPSSEAAKAAVVDGEQAPEIEKVMPAEAATESAEAEPAILKPRPVSLSRTEPPSSDRHSSLDPMPIRSSQGFSSMYSDESDHEANDSADATAHEISAFLERDLASSVVDEDDFADRSERLPTAAEQKPETIPDVDAVAQAETGTTQAPPIEHVAEKSSPEHVLEASRPPPPTAQPLERTAQHAANQAVAEPGSAPPLQGEEAAPAPVSPAVQAADASQAGSDSQRPASPLPETASSPRINHISPETVSQVTPRGDELPTAGPSGSQEVSPGREADPEIDDATTTDPAADLARAKSAEPVLQEAVEAAPFVEPIATEPNGSTAKEERTSTQAGLTVQQQVDDDDTYYAPLEDKSMYFEVEPAGEAASLDGTSEVKQEEAGTDEQAHLAAAAFESSFGRPFVYQGEISVEETFDPAAVEKVYANDPALQDDLDDITDRGVLEALAALRSSPAVSVTNETTPRQPARKSGSRRTTPRRPRSTRTSDSQSRAAPATTPPVSNNGVAPSAGSSPTKRRRPPVDDFILEIFPLKSPRSPKKRSQLEKRSEKRPESPAHVPVASTSKVTLDEPAADRSPPSASNEIPQAAPVKSVEPSVRASRSSAAGSPPLHVTRSASVERVDAGRRASNDYESDSDDPLAAPARPKKKRVSNGMPKQTVKRSRPLPERQSQLSEEESQDSDRTVARELLPAGRAPQRPAEPEAQVARPTPPPAKRRLSEGTDVGVRPVPKRARTTPSTEPRRRPSLAGKGQPVQRRNGVPRIPPPPHGDISSPLPLAASRDGSGALDRSAARTAASTGQSVHHGSRKRRHSDLVSPPLDNDDDDSTQDARPSHRRASVVAGHSVTSKARTVPRSSQGRTPVEAPRASFRSVERTAAARDGNMRDRRPRPTTSSPDAAADGHPEIEEDEAEPVEAGEEAEPVEVKKTPAKARKRAKKRKPLNMPRYKGKKRATPRQHQARPRSPTPEETPSPEPTPPPQQQQQNIGAHAPAVKRKQKKSVGGGSSRGSSQRARQAYDEGEWEG